MNINCIICADMFIPSAEIYTTRCGHIFHYVCLITWLERSRTCPQCRQKTSEKLINRIYFNFANTEGVQEDAVSLQSKVDAQALNLRLKETELKKAEEKYNTMTDDIAILVNKVSEFNLISEKNKSAIGALKEQLIFAKIKAKEAERVEDELQCAKKRLITLEDITKGITGTYEEAQEVARNCNDAKTLSIIMTSLKKEIQLLEKKKDTLYLSLKKKEKELTLSRKEVQHYKKECEQLGFEAKAHVSCEAERLALRTRIEELTKDVMNTSKMDPMIKRVLQESPMPQLTKPKIKTIFDDKSFEIINSPDISTRVKAIKDSDSPYLQVKSNGMGLLLNSQNAASRFGASSSTSIFKIKRSEGQPKAKPVPQNISYNGLGGHDRSDLFSIKSSSTNHGFKRTKPSTVTASKFRKLSKPQNNKLDGYLDISEIE